MAIDAHDPMVLHPVAGQERVVFLKPLVRHPNVEVGEYTYYDDPDKAVGFVFNAHPTLPTSYYDYGNGHSHGKTRSGRRKGERS